MSLGANKQALMGAAGSGGAADDFYDYQIANSARFDGSSTYLTRTAGSASTNSDKKAISFWFKKAGDDGQTGNQYMASCAQSKLAALFVNEEADNVGYYTDNGGQNGRSKFKKRDFSAWYHLVFLYDATQGTGVNRVKYYLNGVHYTTGNTTFWNLDGTGYPGSGTQIGFGMQSNENNIGRYQYNGTGYFNGYIADFIMIDGGTVPSISDFGETKNGVWVPKDPSGLTFGNNGCWLKFTNSSDFGEDFSGNNNDWTANNLGVDHQTVDSPTFGASSTGNCCTLNTLTEQSGLTITEGNLKMSRSSAGNVAIPATMGASTGKYYFEVYWNNDTTVGNYCWGFVEPESTLFGNNTAIQIPDTYNLRVNSGQTYVNGNSATMNSTHPTTGTIIGVAIDFDNGKIFYGQDGGSSSRTMNWNNSDTGTGVPASGTNPANTFTAGSITLVPAFSISSIGDTNWILNFGQSSAFSGALTSQGNADGNGQGDFYYSPPSGFTCWSAGGLSMDANVDPAQTDDNYPQLQFNMLQYTGNGSGRTLETQFQIDMGWNRSTVQAQDWYTLDTSRGWFGASSNNKYLKMNTVDSEATLPQYNFNAQSGNDITLTSGSWFNSGSHTQQMWYWKGNGGTTTTPSGGTLATTVQANTDAGFSIVQYVGDGGTSNFTLAHGLGKKPNMVLLKDRSNNSNNQQWHVFMIDAGSIPNNNYFYTSYASTGSTSTNGTVNSSTTTATVLGMNRTSATGGGMTISQSGHNFLMYVFVNIEGYSKYDMYVGNNSNDGTFVYTGFKPAFILIKDYDSANSWRTYDAINDPVNPADHWMVLDGSAVAINTSDTTSDVDFLSNGFKIRGDSNSINGTDGNKYVYMAWGSNPFKYGPAN
jgi:hypothetical protein